MDKFNEEESVDLIVGIDESVDAGSNKTMEPTDKTSASIEEKLLSRYQDNGRL